MVGDVGVRRPSSAAVVGGVVNTVTNKVRHRGCCVNLLTYCKEAAYLAEETERMHTNVLDYWKYKQSKWPNLALMAKDILAVTASSASSERSFSSGRDMIGISRHRLLPDTVEACICIRSWLRANIAKWTPSRSVDERNESPAAFDFSFSDDENIM